MAILVAIAYHLLYPWRVRRSFKRRPQQEMDVEWTLSTQGIDVRTEDSHFDCRWTALDKAVCTPAGLLLYLSAHIFYWLPRTALGLHEFPRAVELARAHAPAFVTVGLDPTRCHACGYDLRSSPGVCPECGSRRPEEQVRPSDSSASAAS